MPEDKELIVNERLRISKADLRFRFVRSGGPGGQHVNRSATQVELEYDVAGSYQLSASQKALLRSKLKSYLDKEGILHLASQTHRSQLRNREEVTSRFVELLAKALHVPKKRRPTRPSAASRERRLRSKQLQSITKKGRKASPEE